MLPRRMMMLLMTLSTAAAKVPVLEGYRTDGYRAPTPDTVAGATVLDTYDAERLWRQGHAIWIDVVAAPRRPAAIPATSLWRPSPRLGVPGSVWWPDIGRGTLAPIQEAWFRDALARVTNGDIGRPLVFYCLAECWMSWNATKRAVALGYRAVHWYRDGTDEWEAMGLPTEVLQPAEGMP